MASLKDRQKFVQQHHTSLTRLWDYTFDTDHSASVIATDKNGNPIMEKNDKLSTSKKTVWVAKRVTKKTKAFEGMNRKSSFNPKPYKIGELYKVCGGESRLNIKKHQFYFQ